MAAASTAAIVVLRVSEEGVGRPGPITGGPAEVGRGAGRAVEHGAEQRSCSMRVWQRQKAQGKTSRKEVAR
eukprot:11195008-Lingulodinium_polyedra.AAC.1